MSTPLIENRDQIATESQEEIATMSDWVVHVGESKISFETVVMALFAVQVIANLTLILLEVFG